VSSTLVAITETELGTGKLPGAVYTPLALIVPVAALPPEIPFTLQITAVFAEQDSGSRWRNRHRNVGGRL
jgi:hypothetical protein